MNVLFSSLLSSALLLSPAEGVEPPPSLETEAGAPAALEVMDQSLAGSLTIGEVAQSETSSDPGELFVHANEAYEGEDYAGAIRLYKTLLDRGYRDGNLEYNLGNAYLRNGELGRAIAAYRRAEAFLPRDQDLAANLAFARESRKDALDAPQAPALIRALFFWHETLSKKELLRATILCNCLFWGLLALHRVRRSSELLRWSTLVSLLALAGLGGSLIVRTAAPSRVAVVIPQVAEVRSGVSTDAVLRFELHAGAEVRLLERRAGWVRIALPDGAQGWIEDRHVEVVRR